MFRKFSGGGSEIEHKTLYNCPVMLNGATYFISLISDNDSTGSHNRISSN